MCRFPALYLISIILIWSMFLQAQDRTNPISKSTDRAENPSGTGDELGQSYKDSPDELSRNNGNMGSPYVPRDSWIYPAIERLVALGIIPSPYLGIRPWTRMECARMLEEAMSAMEQIEGDSTPNDIYKTLAALSEEFRDETARLDGARNLAVRLDSAYIRTGWISG